MLSIFSSSTGGSGFSGSTGGFSSSSFLKVSFARLYEVDIIVASPSSAVE